MGFHPLAIRYLWMSCHPERSEGSYKTWLITQSGAKAQSVVVRSLAICAARDDSVCGSTPIGESLQLKKDPQTVQEGRPVFPFFSRGLAVGNRLSQ